MESFVPSGDSVSALYPSSAAGLCSVEEWTLEVSKLSVQVQI